MDVCARGTDAKLRRSRRQTPAASAILADRSLDLAFCRYCLGRDRSLNRLAVLSHDRVAFFGRLALVYGESGEDVKSFHRLSRS